MPDPIDRIAHDFTVYCREAYYGMLEIQKIADGSNTTGEAMDVIVKRGLLPSADVVHLETIKMDLLRLRQYMVRINEIKILARKIFSERFTAEEQFLVFNQEVSFSYASKLLVSLGPRLQFFSNNPTQNELVLAEIDIAMRTAAVLTEETDLTCYEDMLPPPKQIRLRY